MVGRTVLVCALLALALPAPADAGGGHYVLFGGTRTERQTVVSALEASSFNWDLVPGPISINIVRGKDSQAIPGQIWLDADLLDAGRFAWGVAQHEYAHQVDYLLLDDERRAVLLGQLGGQSWCTEVPGLPHADYGCERFASTLAWSYWPSPENCMKPESRVDESAAMTPARFRAVLGSMLPGATRRTVGRRTF
jgi:hypothetical protein